MKVLVADDEITARRMTGMLVASFGYELVTVGSGEEALEHLLAKDPPRLAVLDWMMPGVDGIEICRRLRVRKQTPLIYTILLTGRDAQEDLVLALEQGAHDFQTKPVEPNELRCRLEIGARLVSAEDRLAVYAAEMESLAQSRARQLVHADRLVALGTLSAGIVHEINNPIGFISGNAQTQQLMWKSIEPCIRYCLEAGFGDKNKLQFILEEMSGSLKGILQGVERVSAIISRLKGYARKGESGNVRTQVDVNTSIEQALILCHTALKYHVTVRKDLFEPLPSVTGNPQEIEQVLVNLLNNAADAIGEGKGTIDIRTRQAGHAGSESVEVVILDSGCGIPQEIISSLFEPFITTKGAGKGTGLGLSVSREIIADHGGSLTARNQPGSGACFTITLPVGYRDEGQVAKENA